MQVPAVRATPGQVVPLTADQEARHIRVPVAPLTVDREGKHIQVPVAPRTAVLVVLPTVAQVAPVTQGLGVLATQALGGQAAHVPRFVDKVVTKTKVHIGSYCGGGAEWSP